MRRARIGVISHPDMQQRFHFVIKLSRKAPCAILDFTSCSFSVCDIVGSAITSSSAIRSKRSAISGMTQNLRTTPKVPVFEGVAPIARQNSR